VLGLGLYALVRSVRHMLTMPAFFVAVITAFYALLAVRGPRLASRQTDYGSRRPQIMQRFASACARFANLALKAKDGGVHLALAALERLRPC